MLPWVRPTSTATPASRDPMTRSGPTRVWRYNHVVEHLRRAVASNTILSHRGAQVRVAIRSGSKGNKVGGWAVIGITRLPSAILRQYRACDQRGARLAPIKWSAFASRKSMRADGLRRISVVEDGQRHASHSQAGGSVGPRNHPTPIPHEALHC